MKNKQLLTLKQAADIIGYTPHGLWVSLKKGRLRIPLITLEIGKRKRLYISKEALEKAIGMTFEWQTE